MNFIENVYIFIDFFSINTYNFRKKVHKDYEMKDYSKLLKLARDNNGIIQTKMAVENNISKHYLRFAVQDNVLEKVRNGIYITPETMEDELYFLQLKSKNLIYSYETSAYYNGLTTRNPLTLSITTIQGNNTYQLKSQYKLEFHFVPKCKFDLGLTTVKTMYGNTIQIYDKERTICDLFSKNYVGDRYVVNESLKTYLKMEDKNLTKLLKYAKELGVEKELKNKLEILLWIHQDN